MSASAYERTADGKKVRPAKTGDQLVERGLSTSKKQARARARRAAARGQRIDAELDILYRPIDEWDEEELAKGMPRELWKRGPGAAPAWLPRAVHEQVVERYQTIMRQKTNELALPAVRTLEALLENDKVDRKGRPIVSANVKAQCAQWLIEHVIGKPTQKVEADVSVRLQALLGHVMVVPSDEQEGQMEQMQGFLGLAPPTEADDDDDD